MNLLFVSFVLQITIKKLVEEESVKKIPVTSIAKWQCITQQQPPMLRLVHHTITVLHLSTVYQ